MHLHHVKASVFLVGVLICGAVIAQADCRPSGPEVAQLVEIRPGFHRVTGPLAEFDPCHRSVQLSLPTFLLTNLAINPL